MRFIRTHVKNTWYNYKASKGKQSITKAKINKRTISNNSFYCKQAHSGINMTSNGVLKRTCKSILKPVYRYLTCRGDVTCDVTRPSHGASSCWPIYKHKVTIITSIPIFIQMAALTSYFQHICITKVTPIIVNLLSIHSYGKPWNTCHTRYQLVLNLVAPSPTPPRKHNFIQRNMEICPKLTETNTA